MAVMEYAPAPPHHMLGYTRAGSIRVLLIQPCREVREALSEVLNELGYCVIAMATGEEAHAVEAVPDAIVCDLSLPGQCAVALLDELSERAGWEEIPALAVGGPFASGAQRRIATAGFDGLLAKPLSVRTLHLALRQAVRAVR